MLHAPRSKCCHQLPPSSPQLRALQLSLSQYRYRSLSHTHTHARTHERALSLNLSLSLSLSLSRVQCLDVTSPAVLGHAHDPTHTPPDAILSRNWRLAESAQ